MKDGRRWKKDSRTTWKEYKEVRFRDCYGGYTCPNTDCHYLSEFREPNKMNFDKSGTCKVCWAIGKHYY